MLRFLAVVVTMTGIASGTFAQEAAGPSGRSGPKEIRAAIIVLDLDAVNDANQSFDANVFVSLTWSDHQLPETDEATAPMAAREPSWTPHVAFGNQQRIWPVLSEKVQAEFDGDVRWSRGVWGSFSQPLDLRRFPFDRQALNVILLADVGPDQLRFVPDPASPSGVASNPSVPDWTITGFETSSEPFFISEGIDPVPAFTLTIFAKRRILYYVYTMILPLMVIVGMAYVVFWIDPTNFGTQIAVASTSMLTVVTYRIAAVQILPRTAYLTDMDVFIAGCTMLVFASLIATVVATVNFRRGKEVRARQIGRYGRHLYPPAFLIVSGLAFR